LAARQTTNKTAIVLNKTPSRSSMAGRLPLLSLAEQEPSAKEYDITCISRLLRGHFSNAKSTAVARTARNAPGALWREASLQRLTEQKKQGERR
jgi:hypothetical protein